MRRSFPFFMGILALLLVLILLRLLSVSFPTQTGARHEVVYLEEFHDSGHLFAIGAAGERFRLRPLASGIQINHRPVTGPVPLEHGDRIVVRDRPFLFQVHPQRYEFKRVFRRPLFEIWPGNPVSMVIGGWLSGQERRRIGTPRDKTLLKRMLVEIAPEHLAALWPTRAPRDGQLLMVRKKTGDVHAGDYDPTRVLEVSCPHRDMVRVRDTDRTTIAAGSWQPLRSGDLFVFAPLSQGPGKELVLRFQLERVKTQMYRGRRGQERLVSADLVYLVISYRRVRDGAETQEPLHATLRSPETEYTYFIDRTRETLFLGKRGLYRFSLSPDALLGRLHIPDNVREGGATDMKEMIDRQMYYRREGRLRALERDLLSDLRAALRDGRGSMPALLRARRIVWPALSRAADPSGYLQTCESTLTRMVRKQVWRSFREEVERLNVDHSLQGIGLSASPEASFGVMVRTPGQSWVRAVPWTDNTPLVDGIDRFYWSGMISEEDAAEFRVVFDRPPGEVKAIAVGAYRLKQNGRETRHHFFDGIQRVRLDDPEKTLQLHLEPRRDFNVRISHARLRMELRSPDHGEVIAATAPDWQGSIDRSTWVPCKPLPPEPSEDRSAGTAIWYPEDWDPAYRGVKTRYFRGRFTLSSVPKKVRLTLHSTGNHLMWLNDRIVYSNGDIASSLRPGTNTIVLMVSKRGIQKRYRESRWFRLANNRIFLKHKQIHRASFVRGTPPRWPRIVDGRGAVLAYSVEINGRSRRFFSPVANRELGSIFGRGEIGGWGIDQVFAPLVRTTGIEEIELTIDKEWQRIATACLEKTLIEKKKNEISSPRYLNLQQRLTRLEADLESARAAPEDREGLEFARAMERVIRLQSEISRVRTEINQIKNHFYEGSVILMDGEGRLLTAAFYPYDTASMARLNDHVSTPYRAYEIPTLNRAWKWKYNPGSTAKVLDSIAFLTARDRDGRAGFPHLRDLLSPDSRGWHVPRTDLKGSRLRNGKQVFFQLQNFRGHNMPAGFCSLEEALIHSYNTYFGYLALHANTMLMRDSALFDRSAFFVSRALLPIEAAQREFPILEFAEKMGMNRPVDLLANLRDTGLSAHLSRRDYDVFMAAPSVFPVNAYAVSEVAYCAIGQSDFQLTALQNARIACVLLNQGILHDPSIVRSLTLSGGPDHARRKITPDPGKHAERVCAVQVADTVSAAMADVVLRGTAGRVFEPELRRDRTFFAKTGTAETKFYQDNSLFVGHAVLRDGSRVAFSVIVPRSGTGAAVAGRLTADVFREIFAFEKEHGRNL